VSDIAYKYTGGDPMQAHHSSIPARDLMSEDWAALDKEQKAIVRSSPIYERVEATAAAKEDAPKKADDKK
jgi:hypothetical protein